MRHRKIPEIVRAGGYEALLMIGGALAITMHPTMRNAEQVARVIANLRERRNLPRLIDRGLIVDKPGSTAPLQLTKLGRLVMEGGRDPEAAWARAWDRKWRMIAFDLPADAKQERVRFWRWLRCNHFGNLQGSLWITPDPVPAIEKTAEEYGFDPSAVIVCTGTISGNLPGRDVSEKSWNFGAINGKYRRYLEFTERTTKMSRKKALSPSALRKVMGEDRKRWMQAVRNDPLLPKILLPPGYGGVRAWKARRKFHMSLIRSLALPD